SAAAQPSKQIRLYSFDKTTSQMAVEVLNESDNEFTDKYGAISQIKTIGDKRYLFTGWWQNVNEKYILISNSIMESNLRLNCVGIYVELETISINYSESSSISVNGYLHQAFAYVQSSTMGNMVLGVSIDSVNTILNISTLVFSALTNVTIHPENGFELRDSVGNYTTQPLQNLEFKLYSESYNNKYAIASNLAEVADTYIRYSKIHQDPDYFALNMTKDETTEDDVIEINVINNKNSFNVSVISQNQTLVDNNTDQTSQSPVYVVSNNISLNNTANVQYYIDGVKTAYDTEKGKLWYIHQGDELKAYKKLESYKAFIAGYTYEAKFTYDSVEYSFSINTSGNVIFSDEERLALSAIFGEDFYVIPLMDSAKIYIYSTVDGLYPYTVHTLSNVSSVRNFYFSPNGFTNYSFTINAGKVVFDSETTTELVDRFGADFKAEITEDNYTIYIYSQVDTDTTVEILEDGVYCSITDTSIGVADKKYVIRNNVVNRYFPSYTELTVTLAKEYQNEHFVGFEVKYDSGESDKYPTSIYGYSFSLVITESVKIIAQFSTAVNEPMSAIGASGSVEQTPETGAGSGEYGEGEDPLTMVVVNNNASFSTTQYINSVTIRIP
ncbi:MAG: hypothetical protein IJA23_03770, partial [Clostridia bacterium]|nr:hypothetical protein [Clostridia bacterium]